MRVELSINVLRPLFNLAHGLLKPLMRAVRSGEHDRVKQGLQVGLATALAF